MKLFLVLEFYLENYWDISAQTEYKELIRHRFERANTKEEVVKNSLQKATEFIQLEMEKRYEKAVEKLGKNPKWNVKDAVNQRIKKLTITVHEVNEQEEQIHVIKEHI